MTNAEKMSSYNKRHNGTIQRIQEHPFSDGSR